MGKEFKSEQSISLPNSKSSIDVQIISGSLLNSKKQALAITKVDSGEILDITRGMEVWAFVKFQHKEDQLNKEWLDLRAGEGVGLIKKSKKISMSQFTIDLLQINLKPQIPEAYKVVLEVIFPRGVELAKRTSNEAFGVVDGLALIGTQAEAQISSSPSQLQEAITDLRFKCSADNFKGSLVFVVGENGYDLACKSGIKKDILVKTGNWIGPLLVSAAKEKVKNLLLFAYHGKLIKLAGNIFNTHNHLADARIEILVFLAIKEKLPFHFIEELSKSKSIEEAFNLLDSKSSNFSSILWQRIANEIEKKSCDYVNRYLSSDITIGSVMFNKKRCLRWAGMNGYNLMKNFDLALTP